MLFVVYYNILYYNILYYNILYYIILYYIILYYNKGTVVAQWLRFCATNRKVAGSIPDGVIGIFH